jgi:hypothetical protein
VLGIVKNTHAELRGGAAKDAVTMVGNSGCRGTFLWAQEQGATVLNRSAGNNEDTSRYLDWAAKQPPYPFVVASGGNDEPATVASGIMNGIVVGGANDHGSRDRADLTIGPRSWRNRAPGWELPHLVAPSEAVTTVSGGRGMSFSGFCCTSASAPQVSGIAASIQEAMTPAQRRSPEAMFAILMASAEQNVDGVFPLSLSDTIDDKDGAGAVNARIALQIALPQLIGPALFTRGFRFGTLRPSAPQVGPFTAVVQPGRRLRLAAMMSTSVECEGSDCTPRVFPRFEIVAFRTVSVGQTVLPGEICLRPGPCASGLPIPGAQFVISKRSSNGNANYQYVATDVNVTGGPLAYQIQLRVLDWNGLASDDFGMAWTSDE